MKKQKLDLYNNKYSEKELEENLHLFDESEWVSISICQNLSEEFIEKYKYKLDWFYISSYQELSEEFIEKYQDKVDWGHISHYQNLSEGFIKKHINKIYFEELILNKNISNKIKEEIKLLKEII